MAIKAAAFLSAAVLRSLGIKIVREDDLLEERIATGRNTLNGFSEKHSSVDQKFPL